MIDALCAFVCVDALDNRRVERSRLGIHGFFRLYVGATRSSNRRSRHAIDYSVLANPVRG